MATYTKASPGAPTGGFYSVGETVVDSNSITWQCVATGWPGVFAPMPGRVVFGESAGAKNGSTVAAAEYFDGTVHKTVLTLTAAPVTVTDEGGVGQYGGTAKLYDFPAGNIAFIGTTVSGTLTMGATGTFIDAFTAVVAVGSATATTGATLVGTEADIMQSNAVSAATTKVATIAAFSKCTQLTESAITHVNGTATAVDAYLNFVIGDDATHTSGTGTFTGTVTISWINTGDV